MKNKVREKLEDLKNEIIKDDGREIENFEWLITQILEIEDFLKGQK